MEEAALATTTLVRLDPRLRGIDELRTSTPMYDAVIDEVKGRELRIGGHWLVDWASCNYLGLDLDLEIMAAMDEQVHRWGTHPSWSRMLGSPRLYPQIEERLADLLHAPDTLVLPTITQIHLSVIPVLAGAGTIIVDSRAHRTIYDGCVYARAFGATLHRFRSGDLDQLEELLRAAAAGPRLVCIDGVNSMTGNIPNLAEYARLCRDYDALLYVDDAHGFGVIGERRVDETCPYGARGNSIVAHCGQSYDNIVLVGGFSKAYSSLLAFLALPTDLKNILKVAAAPYLFSGPSPIGSLASALAGLDVNAVRGDALRERVYRMSQRILYALRELQVFTPNTDGTPIIELPIAAGQSLVEVAWELWRHGIYVTLAPYPGVPHDQVGFRVQVTAANTDAQVDHLVEVLTTLAGQGRLRPALSPPRPARQREPRPAPAPQ